MGRPIKIIGYLCFLMALCSCKETKEQQISRLIHEWEGRTIVYPADMTFSVLGKDSAGYSLALQVDSDGSVELTTAGTAFGTTTALTDPDQLVNMGKLLDALDDDDDVQNAWTTLENEEDLDR